MSHQPQGQLPLLPQRGDSESIAQVIGRYVRAFAQIVFWILVAIAICVAAYVVLRALWWAAQRCLQALGV